MSLAVLPKDPCIYEIRNTANQRHYIGSAINPPQRRRRHFYDLKRNRHSSRFMQRDYMKCGRTGFVFKILEVVTRATMIEREQYWMDTTNPQYNSAKIAGSQIGLKYGDEVVAANRIRNTGFGNGNAKINPSMAQRIVEMRDKTTTAEMATMYGVHISTIQRVLKRIGKPKNGKRYISNDLREKQREHSFNTLLPARRIPVVMIDEDGTVLQEYQSIIAAANDIGRCVSTMSQAIEKGHRCGGMRFIKKSLA